MCYVRLFFRQSSAAGGVVRENDLLRDANTSGERVCACVQYVEPSET